MANSQTKTPIRESFFSLFLPAGASGLSNGMIAPVLPALAKSFEVSIGAASLVFILQMAGSAIGTLPTGYLIDKIGRRKVVLIGPIIAATSAFMIFFADSFNELLVYRFIGGWGQQMWALSRLTVIADAKGNQRGRQVASMFGAQRVGTLIGPAAGGFIALAWGLQLPFAVQGMVILAGMLPSYFVIHDAVKRRPEATGAANRTGLTWRSYLVKPVPAVFSAQFLVNVARGGVENGGVLFIYGAYAYNAGPAELGVLSSIMAGLSIPIALTAGVVMDKRGRKAAIIPGTLALAGSLLFLASTSFATMPFAAFVGGFVAVQLAVSMMLGSWQTLAADISPTEGRGTFLGMSRLVSHSGRLSSPGSFAILSELSGFGVAFVFLTGAALASTMVIGFLVKETLVKDDVSLEAKPPSDQSSVSR